MERLSASCHKLLLARKALEGEVIIEGPRTRYTEPIRLFNRFQLNDFAFQRRDTSRLKNPPFIFTVVYIAASHVAINCANFER